MTTQTDRDDSLVAALRRGDPTAAEDLVAAWGNRAYHLAWRITGSAPDAEEAVQDAFLSVIRKIDRFREESAFGSWLYRIVANAAYVRCRRRRGRGADVSLDQLLPVFDEHGRHVAPVADWSMSVDDPARQTELRMVLSTAIDELPADYRAVVLLRDVEGLSQQETAEADRVDHRRRDRGGERQRGSVRDEVQVDDDDRDGRGPPGIGAVHQRPQGEGGDRDGKRERRDAPDHLSFRRHGGSLPLCRIAGTRGRWPLPPPARSPRP